MRSGTADDAERPATFRDVLAIREFRAIYAASSLSWVGDYLARAAIAALVYDQTDSVGRIRRRVRGELRALAARRAGARLDRRAVPVPHGHGHLRPGPGGDHGAPRAAWICRPRRCSRCCSLSALFGPPFEAARSATLPAVLPGDRYVVGLALHTSTALPAQVTRLRHRRRPWPAAPARRMALLVNAADLRRIGRPARRRDRAPGAGAGAVRPHPPAAGDGRRLPAGVHHARAAGPRAAGLRDLAVRRGAGGTRRGLGGPAAAGRGRPRAGPEPDHGGRSPRQSPRRAGRRPGWSAGDPAHASCGRWRSRPRSSWFPACSTRRWRW